MIRSLRGLRCKRKGHKWFPNFTSEIFPVKQVCLRCPAEKVDPPTNHPGWEQLWNELGEPHQ